MRSIKLFIQTAFFLLAIFLFSGCSLLAPFEQDEPILTTGIYKSTDNGETWLYLTDPAARRGVPARDTNFLGADPQVPSVLFYGAGDRGIFHSWDAGEHWQSMNRTLPAQDEAVVRQVVFDPQDTNTVYLVGTFDGIGRVVRSYDGGGEWTSLYSDNKGGRAVASMVIHPGNSETIYAITEEFSFIKSEDAGDTWQAMFWFTNRPLHIAIHAQDHDLIFVSTEFDGLQKSTDGGSTWTQLYLEDEKEFPFINQIKFNPIQPDSLYIATVSGLFYSSDHGKTWKSLTTVVPAKNPNVKNFTFHPTDLETIYLAAEDVVYITYNHGESWDIKKLKVNENVKFIVVDQYEPTTIYAGVGS